MGWKDVVVNLVSPPKDYNASIHPGSQYSDSNSKIVTFSSDNNADDNAKNPRAKKTTPIIRRIPKQSLELVYLTEPTIFNGINKIAQLIMAVGYHLIGDDESVKFFTKFFDGIGSNGGELEWNELLSAIFRQQFIYGEAWTELIPAENDRSRIVDLGLIDPKKMDYAKDGNEEIILDGDQNPVGYVETLPYGFSVNGIHNPPETVSLESHQIFFPPETIAHYKLYTVGDLFYGIGLIEPCYDTAIRKIDLEKALANSVRRDGFPLKYAKVGNERFIPTDEVLQKTVEKLKGMDYRDVVVYPDWIEFGYVQSKSPEKLQEHLNYYTEEITTCMGMPKAIITGVGEATNRSTLNRQEAVAKQTLKDFVRRTLRVINKKIIVPVAESNNVTPVKIVWGEISIEDLNGKADRLSSYVKSGLLTADPDTEDLIRALEDLPRRDRSAGRNIVKRKSPEQKKEDK